MQSKLALTSWGPADDIGIEVSGKRLAKVTQASTSVAEVSNHGSEGVPIEEVENWVRTEWQPSTEVAPQRV